jgi:hypothetical protein
VVRGTASLAPPISPGPSRTQPVVIDVVTDVETMAPLAYMADQPRPATVTRAHEAAGTSADTRRRLERSR